MPSTYELGGTVFTSRLIVGSGKYKSFEETRLATEASGAEIITVAVRRINLDKTQDESLLDCIDPKKYKILPNSAGCYTVDDAVMTCRLARELLGLNMIKLEVIGDDRTLFPDNEKTVEAARILVGEGFIVLPYCSDDPIVCKKLELTIFQFIIFFHTPIDIIFF